MDKEIEEIIVKSFFTKRIQDRVLFELFSKKKRKDALGRLCHNYDKTLNLESLIEIKKPISNAIEVANILREHSAGDWCYSISWSERIDGKELPLLNALETAVGNGMPSLISCTRKTYLF
ncbi:hypothetical protein [Bacillus sp. FJAT-25509]|uniref:hypothetical protein n=1 Tax=Bacillus sp. FJAT-25509 TaxID=1712029 RepID=UPI000AB96B39|nr:hypothetical protein [Bacillus sp. FJAT-25509]